MKIIIDEQKKEVVLHLTRRKDFDSNILKTLYPWYKPQPKMEDIDEELRPLIKDMVNNGYRTFNCCSGHGKTTGYVISLPPGKRRLRGTAWEPNEPIPQSISQLMEMGPPHITIGKGHDAIKKWLGIKTSVESRYASRKLNQRSEAER